MRSLLYLAGMVATAAWIIGYIRFHTEGLIYLLLIIAIISGLLAIDSKVKQRKNRAMKTRFLILALAGFIGSAVFSSCNRTPQDRVDEAQMKIERERMDVEKAKRDAEIARLEREQYLNENEVKFRENEKELKEFRTKMERSDKKFRDKYRDKVDQLEKKNRELEDKLKDYNREGKENWESFKKEFRHDMDELGTAIKDLFRNNEK